MAAAAEFTPRLLSRAWRTDKFRVARRVPRSPHRRLSVLEKGCHIQTLVDDDNLSALAV